MHVLLTGATGYLGSRVAKALTRRGHRVTAAVRNAAAGERALAAGAHDATVAPLEDGPRLAQAAISADAVIHTAFGHGHDFSEQVRVEEQAIAEVLQHLSGSGKTVIVSTATGVLGGTGPVPVDDDFGGDPTFPASVRRGIERLVLDASAKGRVRGIVIRPAILVHGHGLSQFVPLLVTTARREGFAGYIGDGLNRISAVHVDDLAELYVLALTEAPAGAIYNTAEHAPAATMREVAEAVAACVGVSVRSIDAERGAALWGPFPAFLLGITNQVSANRARAELGWLSNTSTPSLRDDLAKGSYR